MAKPVPQIILVDGDSIAYRAAATAQHTLYAVLGEGPQGPFLAGIAENAADRNKLVEDQTQAATVWYRVEAEPVENCLHTIKLQLQKIQQRCSEKFGRDIPIKIYLTGAGNFREKIATIKTYKGHRLGMERPVWLTKAREYMIRTQDVELVHDYEADDAVCWEQYERGFQSIIAGIDKDLMQIPGWHYNFMHDGFRLVGRDSAAVSFYRQLIMGDATDNIGGVYRAGEKAAKALILPGQENERRWAIAESAYTQSIEQYGEEKCGYSNGWDACLENARLLYLLRGRGCHFTPPGVF